MVKKEVKKTNSYFNVMQTVTKLHIHALEEISTFFMHMYTKQYCTLISFPNLLCFDYHG